MLYLSVQIWFWVCLSAAIGLMVGLKLQRRKTAFAAAGRPADDLARLDRELSQARAETPTLNRRIAELETELD